MKDTGSGGLPKARTPLLRESEALARARRLIAARSGRGRHTIAAAVLTRAGRIHTGLNIDSEQSWAEICAETGAVAAAISEDHAARIVFAVAVDAAGHVVQPRARSIALLREYGERVRVGLPPEPGSAAPMRVVALSRLKLARS